MFIKEWQSCNFVNSAVNTLLHINKLTVSAHHQRVVLCILLLADGANDETLPVRDTVRSSRGENIRTGVGQRLSAWHLRHED